MQRRLTNWIDSYLHFTRYEESPTRFHLWTAITIISAAVNRNCWMSRGYYKTFPNLYVLFIGPSGVGKSTSSGIGVEILRETSLKVNIYKDSITSPALMNFMSQSKVVCDLSDGKLQEKTPVLIYASELGNLLSQRTGVRELTLLLTELFNKQGDHEDTTNVRGKIKITKPCVVFFACCFPGWIDEELTSVALRSGFLGRMLTVQESAKRHRKDEIVLSKLDWELRADLIHDLELIGALYGQMEFEKEMKKYWKEWYMKQPLEFGYSGAGVEGFTSRKAQFVQRVAMIYSLARSDLLEVIKEDFDSAFQLVSACEGTIKTLGAINPKHDKFQKALIYMEKTAKLNAEGDIDLSILMQKISWFMDKKQLDECIEQLELEGRIKRVGIRKLRIMS